MKAFILTVATVSAAIGYFAGSLNNNNNSDSDGDSTSKHRRLGFLSTHGSLNDPQTLIFKPPLEYLWNGKNIYYQTALATEPTPDKVTRHSYQTMYGRFLLPYYHQHPNMKMLEIGLGCNMNYGPGASVLLYKTLFPQAELWEAEYVEKCVRQFKNSEVLKGINVLTGDQGDYNTLDSWIQKSGGNFDVIIDDGGHQNCQIWNSFMKLWPTVKPGGLYFIEDMEVARKEHKHNPQPPCDASVTVPEKLKEVFDVLIYEDYGKERRESDIESIFCQADACVLEKKLEPDPESVWWNKA